MFGFSTAAQAKELMPSSNAIRRMAANSIGAHDTAGDVAPPMEGQPSCEGAPRGSLQ